MQFRSAMLSNLSRVFERWARPVTFQDSLKSCRAPFSYPIVSWLTLRRGSDGFVQLLAPFTP